MDYHLRCARLCLVQLRSGEFCSVVSLFSQPFHTTVGDVIILKWSLWKHFQSQQEMEWNVLWDRSVQNLSLHFQHTCCLDKSELETILRFLVSSKRYPQTLRPSTQAAHQFLYTACPESSRSCFSRVVGFFGSFIALGDLHCQLFFVSSFPTHFVHFHGGLQLVR